MRRSDHVPGVGLMDVSDVKTPSDRSDVLDDLDLQEFDAGSSVEIRSELQRILASKHFDASERNRRFLEYVVEEALSGRAERIKGYNIATLVFGRDSSFDPQLDPVVRMEARRLRRSLERFYLAEGTVGPLRIAMPKGGYVPKLHGGPNPPPDASEPATNLAVAASPFRRPSIRIVPFEIEDDCAAGASYADGFARQIAVGLSRFPEFSVFLVGRGCGGESGALGSEAGAAQDADLILGGDTALTAQTFEVKATLLDGKTGRVVWGEAFQQDWKPEGLLKTRDGIANRIVRVVADPGGTAPAAAANAADYARPASYIALLSFYRYRRSLRPDLYRVALQHLEQAATSEPDDGEILACRSLLCSDGHRFGFVHAETPILQREHAVDLAQKAVELAPGSSRAHQALGIARWWAGDADAALEALQAASVLNPNAVEPMADLGLHWCLRGEWAKGVRLTEEALGHGCVLAGMPHLCLSLFHFCNGRFEQALADARRIRAEHVAFGFVAQAIALLRLGRAREAAETVGRIVDIDPRYGRHPLGEFDGHCVESTLAATIGSALAEVGLADATHLGDAKLCRDESLHEVGAA